MPSAYEQVEAAFNNAQNYADSALSSLTTFTNKLEDMLFTAPVFHMTWTQINPPIISSYEAFDGVQTITYAPPTVVSPFSASLTGTTFSDFTDVAPTLDLDDPVPVIPDRTVPAVHVVGDVTVETAPTLSLPSEPTFLAFGTVTFAGLDLHADFLTNLETIPALTLVEPTPFSYARGPNYASSLLTSVTANLLTRIQGGSGLAPAVEQAIWDRARDREAALAQANTDEVQRMSDALGFQLPAGAMAAKLREAQAAYFDKVSTLSRDIAIKQADLEQANLKDAIATGMSLESKLIDYSLQLEKIAFDTAKAYADNAIQVYNAGVEAYKAVLDAYRTYAAVYDTIIKAEMTKVEVYKAELQAEMTKAQINTSMVEQYKASIQAQLALVEIYKAQLEGSRTLMEIERLKVQASAEEIKGVVAQINADTARLEGYKTKIQGQQAILEVYKTKADVFRIKVGAESAEAQTRIAEYNGEIQAYLAKVDEYKARVGLEGEKVRAIASSNGAVVEAFKAETMATESEARMHTQIWEARIKEYEAKQNVAVQQAKMNFDAITASRAAQLDAAKAGAQVYAQLTSSAYSMINANASISGSGNTSVSYAYGGDVSGTVPAMTSA